MLGFDDEDIGFFAIEVRKILRHYLLKIKTLHRAIDLHSSIPLRFWDRMDRRGQPSEFVQIIDDQVTFVLA